MRFRNEGGQIAPLLAVTLYAFALLVLSWQFSNEPIIPIVTAFLHEIAAAL